MPEPKPAGTWDYYGACAPGPNASRMMMKTFTLGCFQWQAMSRGKGVKRGKVQYRIKGDASNPRPAHELACEYCDRKNAGMP